MRNHTETNLISTSYEFSSSTLILKITTAGQREKKKEKEKKEIRKSHDCRTSNMYECPHSVETRGHWQSLWHVAV